MIMLCLALGTWAATPVKYEVENHVYVATDGNLHDLIDETDFVLLAFVRPNTGHSVSFLPEFEKAATELRDMPGLKLVKVVVHRCPTIVKEFQAPTMLPSLRFFHKWSPIKYTGGHAASEIVAWLRKRASQKPSIEVTTLLQLDELLKDSNAIVVGAFDRNSNETQKFLEASRRSKSVTAFTHDPELAAQRGLAFPGVTSFKKESRPITDETSLTEYIRSFEPKTVLEYQGRKGSAFSFVQHRQALLFADPNHEGFQRMMAEFEAVADMFDGQFIFLHIGPQHTTEMGYFNIKPHQLPVLRVVDLYGMFTYPYNGPIERKQMGEFLHDYYMGNVRKTEALPDNWDDGLVKYLTNVNHDQYIATTPRHVVILYGWQEDQYALKIRPKFYQLAEVFASDDRVVFAIYDVYRNDILIEEDGLRLFFIDAYRKTSPIRYAGGYGIRSIAVALKRMIYSQVSLDSIEPDEDDLQSSDPEINSVQLQPPAADAVFANVVAEAQKVVVEDPEQYSHAITEISQLDELLKHHDTVKFGAFISARSPEAKDFFASIKQENIVAAHTYDARVAAIYGMIAPKVVVLDKTTPRVPRSTLKQGP